MNSVGDAAVVTTAEISRRLPERLNSRFHGSRESPSKQRSLSVIVDGNPAWKKRSWSRTNNVIERLNREIRRKTRVVGAFPDGNSALMLVCARLRYVAGTQWGGKKHMRMKHLEVHEDMVG